jgi:hypothetical protein
MRKPLEKAGADLLCASYKSAFKLLDEAVPPHPEAEAADEAQASAASARQRRTA